LRTTARTGTAVPTGTIEQAAGWSRGPQRERHNRLQCVREAPGSVPEVSRCVRGGVRQTFGSGPNFMINIKPSGH